MGDDSNVIDAHLNTYKSTCPYFYLCNVGTDGLRGKKQFRFDLTPLANFIRTGVRGV